jgi:hypothetical protein
MKQNPFIISAAVAALVLVAALGTLGALASFSGQKSGLEKSGKHDCPAQVANYGDRSR